jgi:hypothetical protein
MSAVLRRQWALCTLAQACMALAETHVPVTECSDSNRMHQAEFASKHWASLNPILVSSSVSTAPSHAIPVTGGCDL